MGETHTQTDIATTRMSWTWGQFIENKKIIQKINKKIQNYK